jgi:fructose-specific phosphotransferase system IIC component
MKVHVEIDCTPEEARTFLGLPDVGKANAFYVEAMAKAMKGAGNVEQLQEFAKNLAPMGQVGMKLFQQFIEGGAAFAAGAGKKKPDGD